MAKVSVYKKAPKLNLTRRQIAIFREIINQGNQMASFLDYICHNKIESSDLIVIVAEKMAIEWGDLIVRLLNETI